SNTASLSQSVSPAILTVTADNKAKDFGAALPTLTAHFSGFVNGEDASVLSGAPALSTTATASSAVGSYAIVAAQGSLSAANYALSFVNGTLTVQASGTSATLSSSAPSGSTYGQAVTFTTVVQPAPTGGGTPTGTVQFVVDGSPFGQPVTLAGGSASLSTSS